MERNVPLKVPLCQHVTLFNDQLSVSVVIHFVLCDLLSIYVCVHKHLLGCCAPWQALAAPQCSFQEPHPQEKWRCWVPLICFQIGTRLTSILSREPQRTKNMHSVSTTQAPVVEHRSETDWLTTAVGMAQVRDETWWHVLVGFVPPTAEVSCCGTFLLEIRCFYWVYKQWEGLGHCPPGSLGSCVGSLAEWCSTNADHQHKTICWHWCSQIGEMCSASYPCVTGADLSSSNRDHPCECPKLLQTDPCCSMAVHWLTSFFLTGVPPWNLLDAGVWA